MQLLLCDPAFRNFGWAILELRGEGELVTRVGVVRTEKSDKKSNLLAADDNHRCVGEIVNALDEVRRVNDIVLVCAESQSGSKNAHAVQLQGMAWGALSAFTFLHRLPMLQATPQSVKKRLCQRKDASKDDIKAAVLARYPSCEELVEKIRPPSSHEHIYDAIAVGITCLDSATVQTMRHLQMRKGKGAA